MCVISNDRAKRNNIGHQDRPTADKGMVADPAELMNSNGATKPNLLTDIHMAANVRVIGDHALVPEHTIVRRVRVRHEQAIGADFGQASMFRRACV